MLKKLLAISALVCGALPVGAKVNYMTVEQKSGDKFSFLLADNPVVTYKNGELVVNDNASTSYAIDGVKNYHFTETNQTGVENVCANMLRIVYIDENTIGVENAVTGSDVALVNASGVIVATGIADQTGRAIVALPSAKGVYVLTVGKQSLKLINK